MFDTFLGNVKTAFRHIFMGRTPEEIARLQEIGQNPYPINADSTTDFLVDLFTGNLEKNANKTPAADPPAVNYVYIMLVVIFFALLVRGR